MDDITGSENLPFFGVDIVYTRESIDDGVGDTVSNDSTKTLQDLVNEAPDGKETVITLKKHVKLGSTLTIPAGKMIKITSDKPYTSWQRKVASLYGQCCREGVPRAVRESVPERPLQQGRHYF